MQASTENLSVILRNAQVADASTRTAAEQQLETLEQQDLPGYLTALANELYSSDRAPEVRKLAGLLLKNSLDARDTSLQQQRVERWQALPDSATSDVKSKLLQSLHSHEAQARHTAAQAIGKVARADLHRGHWQSLVPSLRQNMESPSSNSGLRQATMETLGYVCEETAHQSFEQSFVDHVLTTVVRGINATTTPPHTEASSQQEGAPDNEVRLAATEALHNALSFAEENFKRDNERNYIMQVVCEGTRSNDARIRQASYECLVAIATEYYPYLMPYMNTIFELTKWTVHNDEESVALQAIEFWSSIAEEEAEREEAREDGDESVTLHNFVKGALQYLVPLLLETLTQQADPDEDDPDLWNIAMAGGTCLALLSTVAKDDVVPLVMPYVDTNVSKENWREREAATYAYGSIMEGPDPSKLVETASMAVPYMLQLLKDNNLAVRDTAAWTLGRMFECVHGREGASQIKLVTEQNLHNIVYSLLESLQSNDHARVTEKVCYAMQRLVSGFESSDNAQRVALLTQHFQQIAYVLLKVSDRRDAGVTKVRSTAYEAVNELVRVSSHDTDEMVLELVQKMTEQLEMCVTHFDPNLSEEQRTVLFEMQGSICGSLQVMIQKLGQSHNAARASLLNSSDKIMEQLIKVLTFKNSTVIEEAFLAIGSLATVNGQAFDRYMGTLFPYLQEGLKNHEHFSVCQVAVGLVGDLCRALEGNIQRYCDSIVPILLTNLQSSGLNMKVKPPIISTLGDLALAIGAAFKQYLESVMTVLFEAAQTSVQTARQASHAREDMLETNHELRKSIFEAFSGIFMGFKDHREAVDMLKQYGDYTTAFLEEVAKDIGEDDPETLSGALGLLGDVAEALPSQARSLQKPGVELLMQKGTQNLDPSVHQPANRAYSYVLIARTLAPFIL